MAVSTMQKMTAIVLRSDADTVIKRLMWLSCVEVIPVNNDIEKVKHEHTVSPYETECADAERSVIKLRTAIKLLKNYVAKEKKDNLLSRRPNIARERYDADISEYSAEYKAVERTEEISYRLSEIVNEKINLFAADSTLQPWISCPIPLDFTKTKETRVWFGTLPPYKTAGELSAAIQGSNNGQLPCTVDFISEDTSGSYFIIIYHESCEDIVYSVMSSTGFNKLDLREYGGTAAENITRIGIKMAEADNEYSALEDELRFIAESIGNIKIAYDAASARLTVMTAKKKLFETRETVVLTGWVPFKAVEKVTSQLEKMCCCYEFNEPQKDDEVPVLLQNIKPASAFEMVVGLYSMPVYGSFDPTFIMSVFYFIIFGLMLGDAVYGLLLVGGGFLATRFLDLDSGVKRLVRMFSICGISCIISGILFGSYLGDLPVVLMDKMFNITVQSPALLFDPVTNPVMFLVIALAAGVVHLAVGMCIKFYILWTSGRRLSAIFDVGSWFVLFIGIGVYALRPDTGKYIALTGVAMLILTQGRTQKNIFLKIIKGVGSLYGLVNYAADLLSYSRIMALGMATAVIASVVNILATLAGPSVIGFIVMVIIVLAGHTVNLAINLLGTFVHTSRLQYIEFFGKFYEDGGRLFKPVRVETKYTHAELK